jgi:hypothetical protein
MKRHGGWKSVSKTRINFQEKFFMASQIKNFRNQRPQCIIKKTRKIRGMNMNFRGKEGRLQELYKFPESVNILNKSTYRSRTQKLRTVEFIVSNE